MLTTFLYLGFIAAISLSCFRHPVANDFDRYIYEALVRGKAETIEAVYPTIKHSYKRAEESSVLDSPTHLGQLEPLYAIKPLYVEAIEATAFIHLPIQTRITMISAIAFFGIGLVVLGWTGRPGYSALLIATSAIVVLGRMGTPDGLSTLVIIAGLWAIARSRLLIGVLLLLISIWIRTDNVLLVLVVLGYLLWQKRITIADAVAICALAVGSVLSINHFAENYGWRVLFQFSFIGGRSPAEISPHLSVAQYLGVFGRGARTMIPQLTIWALIGIAAWKWPSPCRGWLIPVWITVLIHFMLYPSPESRYLAWAFVVTGVIFIRGLHATRVRLQSATDTA